MCRLFGVTAGSQQANVKYWVLDAPDSVEVQGQRNRDGAGIGWFDEQARPHVRKQAGAAPEDSRVLHKGALVKSSSVLTHVRAATAGTDKVENCHPFKMPGFLMAHNGGFAGLDKVEKELGSYAQLVHGDTDSERYAALIAKNLAHNGGNMSQAIVAAASWLSQNVPMYSLNTIVVTNGQLWALRYPDERSLHVARRVVQADTGNPDDQWSGSSTVATHQVVSNGETPVVVVASERIDGEADWQMLQPGELIHVDQNLTLTSTLVLQHPPAMLVSIEESDPNQESF